MVSFLISFFIKDKTDYRSPEIRQQYGTLCGLVGIGFNLLLFAGKLIAGLISGSIAIMADALNNLSDAGSSLVTLAGFRMAGSKPDPDHPFGHGRIEYLSGLAVSAAILIMAYQLILNSAKKIIHPEQLVFEPVIVVILAASILIKGYMAYYNRQIGKKIDSAAMRATSTDSLSDMLATTVVLISVLVFRFTGIQIDAYCGILVGLFIFYAGIKAAKETVDPLLGKAPKQEFIDEITSIVLSYPKIVGIHDMVVHDYGPGRQMISLHAEIPAEEKILVIHDIIDNIEAELSRRMGIQAVIHMDPVVTTDETITRLKEDTVKIITEVGKELTLHDFRVVPGDTHTNVIFDLVVPYRYEMGDQEIQAQIQSRLQNVYGENYFTVIQIDRDFIGNQG